MLTIIDDVKRCTTTCDIVNLLSLLTSTNFCFRCTYSIMHHGTHIFGRWSSICTWTSCQTPQFLSGCNPRNCIHLWRQNYGRILCWPWSRLSTFSCLRSSLGVWGKRRFLSHRHSQNFRNMNRNIESWCVVWVVEGSRVVAKGGLKSPY